MALEVAGVFHGENHFLLCQIVLAEYVETVFLEVAVEPGSDLSDLALDDAAKRLSQTPVFILDMSYISAILKTVAVTAFQNAVDVFLVL